MNSFGKAFLSLFLFGFIGAGIYFGAIKALDIYKNADKQALKKKISVKPEDIREKQSRIDSWPIDHDEYTFFDTLDDVSMSKFVGLDEVIIEPQKLTNRKVSDFKSKIKKKYILQSNNVGLNKPLNSLIRNNDAQAKLSSLDSGFILQVGSFKTLERANLLKDNLDKKGYSTFVMTTRLSEEGEVWHRVVIGIFKKKEAAVNTAVNIEKIENLDSVVIWKKDLGFPRN